MLWINLLFKMLSRDVFVPFRRCTDPRVSDRASDEPNQQTSFVKSDAGVVTAVERTTVTSASLLVELTVFIPQVTVHPPNKILQGCGTTKVE